MDLSHDGRTFYITTAKRIRVSGICIRCSIDGGPRTKISSMVGSNQAQVSPDDFDARRDLFIQHKPPEVFVMPNRPGAAAKQVTVTPTAEWRSFNWIDPKVITFTARDGVEVYARLFTPEMIGAKRDPAASRRCVRARRRIRAECAQILGELFPRVHVPQPACRRGATSCSTSTIERAPATAATGAPRSTGTWEARTSRTSSTARSTWPPKEQVNPKRIGVYGGSYGGFITLMAMFTTPDVFAAGAALRPVTDWAHYNHGYTSNILNVPQKDTEAYRKSSPIYFAEGLKGALLICHGMVDTNVHFQDSVRLVQRLIELRKENWSFAPYPVENHGFTEAASWADEYKRILKLFEDNLRTPHNGKAT